MASKNAPEKKGTDTGLKYVEARPCSRLHGNAEIPAGLDDIIDMSRSAHAYFRGAGAAERSLPAVCRIDSAVRANTRLELPVCSRLVCNFGHLLTIDNRYSVSVCVVALELDVAPGVR